MRLLLLLWIYSVRKDDSSFSVRDDRNNVNGIHFRTDRGIKSRENILYSEQNMVFLVFCQSEAFYYSIIRDPTVNDSPNSCVEKPTEIPVKGN